MMKIKKNTWSCLTILSAHFLLAYLISFYSYKIIFFRFLLLGQFLPVVVIEIVEFLLTKCYLSASLGPACGGHWASVRLSLTEQHSHHDCD